MKKNHLLCAMATGVMLSAGIEPAQAMNTTQTNATGAVESMMGGASIANPLTSAVAGDNPAGMAFVGNRADQGVQVLVGHAQSSFGDPSNRQAFDTTGPMPDGGFNVTLGERLSLGLSIGSAGGGVNYPGPALPIPGAPPAKAKNIFVNFLPTIAYRVTPDLAIGVSAILGVQKFEAQSILAPAAGGGVAVQPTHGMTTTYGAGGGIGVMWNVSPLVTVGASYSTRVRFSRASGYADDLFAAGGGHLDEPSRVGAGLALHLSPRLTVAADILRIQWSHVAVLGDPDTFGLRDQTVVRAGLSWAASDRFTVRFGGKHATDSIDSQHTAANYFAPLILTDSISGGFTWRASPKWDVSAGYEYDFPKTVTGSGASAGTNIHARYSLIMLNLGRKF
ncbi:OmpP1/FadL family transporter [Burkholderia paludis]|uniref:OmpP1/FadL family transporter n=1 Tax=Burkholderia paludis TaxID=1506587 RepID=UPI0009DD683C|nr:outer membrane protein transport protein [Burkholderia paludis]